MSFITFVCHFELFHSAGTPQSPNINSLYTQKTRNKQLFPSTHATPTSRFAGLQKTDSDWQPHNQPELQAASPRDPPFSQNIISEQEATAAAAAHRSFSSWRRRRDELGMRTRYCCVSAISPTFSNGICR